MYLSVCESGTALKKLLEACHGHKHCSIASDTRFFGDPCVPGTPKYLRVVFTCGKNRNVEDYKKYILKNEDFILHEFVCFIKASDPDLGISQAKR